MPLLEPGSRVPDFTVAAHDGEVLSLADFIGKRPLVVFFYPRSGTPVCTREADAFRETFQSFVEAGAAVIGVSGCSPDRQRRFATERKLPFLLVSDADGHLRRAFGVTRRLGILPDRVTFVIDREGIVRHVTRALFAARAHVTEALAAIRALAAPTPAGE